MREREGLISELFSRIKLHIYMHSDKFVKHFFVLLLVWSKKTELDRLHIHDFLAVCSRH